MLPKDPLVEGARFLVHLAERCAPCRAARLLRIGWSQVDAGLACELLDGVAEAPSFHLHHELDRVSRDAAAEAVEHLLVGDDIEAGGLLPVKGAEALPVAPALLQRHAPLHDGDQVHPVPQLLKLLVGNARQLSRREDHLPWNRTLQPEPGNDRAQTSSPRLRAELGPGVAHRIADALALGTAG